MDVQMYDAPGQKRVRNVVLQAPWAKELGLWVLRKLNTLVSIAEIVEGRSTLRRCPGQTVPSGASPRFSLQHLLAQASPDCNFSRRRMHGGVIAGGLPGANPIAVWRSLNVHQFSPGTKALARCCGRQFVGRRNSLGNRAFRAGVVRT